MNNPVSTRDAIIELAQASIAERGYASFSFRELADALGIKSASVHYHFPTKSDLGVAVASQYRAMFAKFLTTLDSKTLAPQQNIKEFVQVYRQEARNSLRMTVCIMLATEAKQLPEPVQQELALFYQFNIQWLKKQLSAMGLPAKTNNARAKQIMAILQGGLIGAKAQNDMSYFNHAADLVEELLTQWLAKYGHP